MDVKTRRWVEAATHDVHEGLMGAEAYDRYELEDYSYERALRRIETWCSDSIEEVWVDVQTETVLEDAPKDEVYVDDETGESHIMCVDWNDYIYYDRHAVGLALFGALVTDGGLNV
jgi:hypothetical protein